MEVLRSQLAVLESEYLLAILFTLQVFRIPAPLRRANPSRLFFFTFKRTTSLATPISLHSLMFQY